MTEIIIDGLDNHDDTINQSFSNGDTLISSTFGGNDYVGTFQGQYLVHLGAGNDTIQGGSAGTAYGEGGDDTMNIYPGNGLHNQYGGAGNDNFVIFAPGGSTGTVNAYGGSGRDILTDSNYSTAIRNLDGGTDFDVVIIGGASGGVAMTLGGGGSQGSAIGASYQGIEGVVTGSSDDTLTGNRGDNLLVGGGGSDQLFGLGGDDFLIGEYRQIGFLRAYLGIWADYATVNALDPLNCNASGGYADDFGALNDSLYGGSGNDVLSGGNGADLLNGGTGSDWATYRSAGSVVVDLGTGGVAGHAAGDIYVSIENAQGSDYDDGLTGNDGANELRGMGGQDLLTGLGGGDVLNGGAGRDTLAGGKGADTLTGGDWEDCFVFAGAGTLALADTVTDLQVNFDEIWLSAAVFRKAGPLGTLAAERFALGTATEGDDRILYDAATGALSYDADGNRAGAAVQFAQLATGLTLNELDFVIIA